MSIDSNNQGGFVKVAGNTDDIRRLKLSERRRLTKEEILSKSARATENLLSMQKFESAGLIMFYVNFRSELVTLETIRISLQSGKRIAVPLTSKADFRLLPYELIDADKDLKPGYCSIPEPDPAKTQTVIPAEIDLVIVPGSVFDERGGRLGYGGGFYDRFLAHEAPQATRVGLAFEMQVVSELHLEAHDQLLDFLVTEEKVRCFANDKKMTGQ